MKTKTLLDKCIDCLVGNHKYIKTYNLCAEAVSQMKINSIFDHDKAMDYLGLAELYYENLNAISKKYSIQTKKTEKELRALKQNIADFSEILECRKKLWLI